MNKSTPAPLPAHLCYRTPQWEQPCDLVLFLANNLPLRPRRIVRNAIVVSSYPTKYHNRPGMIATGEDATWEGPWQDGAW